MNRSGAAKCLPLIFLAIVFSACGEKKSALNQSEKYVQEADSAYSQQNIEEAVEGYKQALQSGVQTVKVHNNLGNAFFKDERFNAAKESYRKSLELDPEYFFSINNLALALYHSGEVEKAYDWLSRAISNFPSISFFQTTYGYLLYAEGDRKGALEAFKKAIELNPDSPAALNNVGALYLEDSDSGEDPLPYLKRALEKDNANQLFHDTLGWYYYKKGMFAEATIEIGKAFLYDPNNIEVQVHYASVLEWIGKEQEALNQWDKIVELADESGTRKLAVQHSWEIRGRLGQTASGE